MFRELFSNQKISEKLHFMKHINDLIIQVETELENQINLAL